VIRVIPVCDVDFIRYIGPPSTSDVIWTNKRDVRVVAYDFAFGIIKLILFVLVSISHPFTIGPNITPNCS
jgi:hypothetical protein